MAFSRDNAPFAYCILCLRPLYMKASTVALEGRSGPNEFTRVKKHYQRKHPKVFDQRYRR